MGVIKINNIIYGSNNASDILYKNITVEEKLDTIPIFDINDNGAVVVESDVLTYGHIVDNLNSTESNKILSAKQGKILSEKIDNIDLSYLEEDILAVENKIDNFQVAKKITQAAYDALPEEEKNNGIYVIEDDEGNIFVARNIEYDGSKTGLGATVQQAIDNVSVAINNINEKLPFQLGVDSNGNYGYIKDGADSVTPFKYIKTGKFTGGKGTSYTININEPFNFFVLYDYGVSGYKYPAILFHYNGNTLCGVATTSGAQETGSLTVNSNSVTFTLGGYNSLSGSVTSTYIYGFL